jgi:hypothetical protein
MRYVMLLLCCSIIVSCSKTPEQKACEAIKDYLKHNLDDPRSYEPGEFETEAIYDYGPDYHRKKDSIDALFKAGKLDVRQYSVQDSLLEHQEAKVVGWNITHAFRSKNKFGALTGATYKFHVDTYYNVQALEQLE